MDSQISANLAQKPLFVINRFPSYADNSYEKYIQERFDHTFRFESIKNK